MELKKEGGSLLSEEEMKVVRSEFGATKASDKASVISSTTLGRLIKDLGNDWSWQMIERTSGIEGTSCSSIAIACEAQPRANIAAAGTR